MFHGALNPIKFSVKLKGDLGKLGNTARDLQCIFYILKFLRYYIEKEIGSSDTKIIYQRFFFSFLLRH